MPLAPREGLTVEAWEHYRDDIRCCWVVTVRWSDGLVQGSHFTDQEIMEMDPLHRVRALLP